jgi:REP element-mobilizing transposase RayT
MITKRPRRLVGVSYVGFQRYFVTTCTAFRRPFFLDLAIGNDAVSQILQSAGDQLFDVTAYCLMPDHAHLLLSAQSQTSDVCQFVKQTKQITGFRFRRVRGERLWQPGYHDRILRDDEATLTVAKYILENPVRAGLAKVAGKWPLSGSGVYTWPELFSAWEQQTQRRG